MYWHNAQTAKPFTKNGINNHIKAFARPHLDYRDVLFDETYNWAFHYKLESIK